MDNASVHRKLEIIALCAQFNVLVLFLPPYSYDFNPIEKAFHIAKAYVRRMWGEAEENESVVERMREALWSVRDADQACNLFQNFFIDVTPAERQWANS